jgi:Trk K+ transport system NAD-binding subunit
VSPLVDQLLVGIEYPEIKGLMRIGNGAIDVFEVRVPPEAAVAGMTVEAIVQMPGFPATCNFVAVEPPGGTLEIARGTTQVAAGAMAIVLAMEVDLHHIVRLLTKPLGRGSAV